MRGRRSKKRVGLWAPAGGVLTAALIGVWWFWPRAEAGPQTVEHDAAAQPARLAPVPIIEFVDPEAGPDETTLRNPAWSHEESTVEDEPLTPIAPRAALQAAADEASPQTAPEVETSNSLSKPPPAPAANNPAPSAAPAASNSTKIQAALQRYARGERVEARHELNQLFTESKASAERNELRQALSRIADETIFSTTRIANDPLTEEYVVRKGDTLEAIGKRFAAPYEILMLINGITDPRRIQVDKPIKVIKGPFNARVVKSEFRLDLYAQELFVRSFPVALGAEPGTPEGRWRVKERLKNPTYYPSANAKDQRVKSANDPTNPLGEFWIGLIGIDGDAKGRDGYGIHGTIEPDSIGRAVSLGCVRMLHDDIAFVYGALTPAKSLVTVVP